MSSPCRVVFLDNVDSFTYNLVDEFARRGALVEVHRNDRPAAEVFGRTQRGAPTLVVVSPGPGTPGAAGCSIDLIRACAGRVPVFGVCLGHQAIVEALGGHVERAPAILHGKAALAVHDGTGVFAGIPSPMPVGRYHSLAASRVPPELRVTATCDDIVMAVEHERWPMVGVQFHPESVLTPAGGRLIENVLAWAAHAGQ